MAKKTWRDDDGHIYREEHDDGLDWATEDDGYRVIQEMVLFGGPQVGFMTNPESHNRQPWIEVNGEKVVCTAQGGECRYNPRYYSPGLRDAKSWTTPIIDHSCPNECPFKSLVCDNHAHADEENVRTFFPYPQYNKFHGQFRGYCRCTDRLDKK
jgi:hypothetical protein